MFFFLFFLTLWGGGGGGGGGGSWVVSAMTNPHEVVEVMVLDPQLL